jgi:hypothetical protein
METRRTYNQFCLTVGQKGNGKTTCRLCGNGLTEDEAASNSNEDIDRLKVCFRCLDAWYDFNPVCNPVREVWAGADGYPVGSHKLDILLSPARTK